MPCFSRSRSKEREKKRRRRLNESDAEKEKRKATNRENMMKTRNEENDSERENRKATDRQNKMNVKNADRAILIATKSDVSPFSVGLMNKVCRMCSALMFAEETHRGKVAVNGGSGTASFSMCCR